MDLSWEAFGEAETVKQLKIPEQERENLLGEEERIRQALKISGGNKGKAAELLGIDRSTLWRRMKKYGI